MMDVGTLSELCTICHSEKPKYRCPRCKSQTCSLSCYKRHQQRASCSGKRNPAAYVKKNEWATPAGVDRDYNYLKSVERTIDDASQAIDDPGNGSHAYASRNATRAWVAGSTLQRYLARNSITVEHAPKGISRQKYNQTRTTKSGKIVWTIEWINGDGQRIVQDGCPESSSLQDLYSAFQIEQNNIEQRRSAPATNKRGTKRKREEARKDLQCDGDAAMIRQQNEFLQSIKVETDADPSPTIKSEPADTEELKVQDRAVPSCSAQDVQVEAEEEFKGSSSPVHFILDSKDTAEVDDKFEDDDPVSQAHTQHKDSKPDCYFYLLKPGIQSACRVLIPLEPSSTLTESLRGQTIREYPTIYLLPNPPQSLSAGFMLESKYLKTLRLADISSGLADLPAHGQSNGPFKPEPDEAGKEAKVLDPKRILDMLKRDITR